MTLKLCDVCHASIFDQCSTTITVPAGLTPATAYFIRITDKNGVKISETKTTNSSGDFVLTLADYSRTFNAYSGSYELTAFDDETSSDELDLTIDAVTYKCSVFSFYKSV